MSAPVPKELAEARQIALVWMILALAFAVLLAARLDDQAPPAAPLPATSATLPP